MRLYETLKLSSILVFFPVEKLRYVKIFQILLQNVQFRVVYTEDIKNPLILIFYYFLFLFQHKTEREKQLKVKINETIST